MNAGNPEGARVFAERCTLTVAGIEYSSVGQHDHGVRHARLNFADVDVSPWSGWPVWAVAAGYVVVFESASDRIAVFRQKTIHLSLANA